MAEEVFLVTDLLDELIRYAEPHHPYGLRLRKRFGHGAAETAGAPVLLESHDERDRSGCGRQRLSVERPQRVHVQHSRLNTQVGEDIRGGEAGEYRVRTTTHEDHVAALSQLLWRPDGWWMGGRRQRRGALDGQTC